MDGLRVTTRFESLVRSLPNDALARPATQLGTHHELGSDPGHRTEVTTPASLVVLRRRFVVWRIVDGQRLELGKELLAGAGCEPRPHLATELELAVLVVADRQGAEISRVSLPRRPATDDELLLGSHLELQPCRRPLPGLIPAPPKLGD